ncbi:hypothetical protein PFISCL1PPCAC_21891, partial [Pristionchus fissidentatus]
STCRESHFREVFEFCTRIRCTDRLHIHAFHPLRSNVLTDESLRKLMSNKKNVNILVPCEAITANGISALWEDLLDGKFDELFINLSKSVVIELFNLIRTDGVMSSCDYR